MLHIQAGLLIQDRPCVLRCRPLAVGRKGQLTRMGLDIGNGLLGILGRELRRSNEHHDGACHLRDGSDILHGIKAPLEHMRNLGQDIGHRHQQGIAV